MQNGFVTIKDYPNYEINRLGQIRNIEKGNILKPHVNRLNNFKSVKLYRGYNDFDCKYIHNVMVETFYNIMYDKWYVVFKDDDPSNINLSNLRVRCASGGVKIKKMPEKKELQQQNKIEHLFYYNIGDD